ncbi:hypothetical protein D3C71_1816520 [compost metagenome]
MAVYLSDVVVVELRLRWQAAGQRLWWWNTLSTLGKGQRRYARLTRRRAITGVQTIFVNFPAISATRPGHALLN